MYNYHDQYKNLFISALDFNPFQKMPMYCISQTKQDDALYQMGSSDLRGQETMDFPTWLITEDHSSLEEAVSQYYDDELD